MNSWAGSLALESPSISLNLRLRGDSPALSGAALWVSQIGWEILASPLLYLVQIASRASTLTGFSEGPQTPPNSSDPHLSLAFRI